MIFRDDSSEWGTPETLLFPTSYKVSTYGDIFREYGLIKPYSENMV